MPSRCRSTELPEARLPQDTIAHTAAQLPGIYLYTAPATMPMSGNTVTITVISQADPSKTASSTITLQ